MALVKGVNSPTTVVETDEYFADRLDVAAWTVASEDAKSQALTTATMVLDDLEWSGVAVNDNSTFPRTGVFFDPRLGKLVDMNPTPDRYIRAVRELAYHLLNNDGLFDDTGFVKKLKVGAIELTDIKGDEKIPSFIKRIIKPLLVNAGANIWWRAN